MPTMHDQLLQIKQQVGSEFYSSSTTGTGVLRGKPSGGAISQSRVGSCICCKVLLKECELITAVVVADVAVQHDEMGRSHIGGIVLP